MTNPTPATGQSGEAMRDKIAKELLRAWEDCDSEWLDEYWQRSKNEPHRGDCFYAEHKGAITCDRCVVEDYRRYACAALAAMREPDPQMLAGVENVWPRGSEYPGERSIWRAMIDAALAEGAAHDP